MRQSEVNNNEHDNLSFKTWVINLFEDERERTSIKPVIAFLGALFLCGSMLINSLYPQFVPADYLVDAVMIITAIGMGADSLDKFSLRSRLRHGNTYRDNYSNGDYGDNYYGSEQYNQSDNDDANIGESSNQLL